MTLGDDVRLGISLDSKPTRIQILEEECNKPGSTLKSLKGKKELTKAARGIKENLVEQVELEHFDIIPISSSPQFHKVSNRAAYHDFMDSLNVMTEVIDSDNKALIGTKRSILNQKHLGTIGFLLNPENQEECPPQLTALLQPSGILEEDLFWDNFWLFKKREEEKRVIQADLDSDEEIAHGQSMKIGEIMNNPQLLINKMLSKRFKKIRKHLLFINSIGGITLMTVLFAVQLRYSRRFRKYTKTVVHLSSFILTFLGFSCSFYFLYKSVAAKFKRPKKQIQKDEYNIENEELPELKSDIEFKKKMD